MKKYPSKKHTVIGLLSIAFVVITLLFITQWNSESIGTINDSPEDGCKYVLSDGSCLADDKIDMYLPHGFLSECKEGYKQSSFGFDVCVKIGSPADEEDGVMRCSDEWCYPNNIGFHESLQTDAYIIEGIYPNIVDDMNSMIIAVQESNQNEITTTQYDRCNFTISYEKEFKNRFIWHDWKFEFYTWEQCNPDTRTSILNVYSDLVDERLLILNPPITKTYTSFKLCNWNPECDSFYMELHSDGYRMIEFRTFANGLQQITLDGDEPDPTEKELCLEYNIDVTPDGSCRYQILNERVEALEKKLYSNMGSTLSEFNSGYDPTGLSKKQMDEVSKQYNECDGSFLFVNNFDGTYYVDCLVDYGGASGTSGSFVMTPEKEALQTALEEWALENQHVIYYKQMDDGV
ncbi:MAG: hypothetical protein K5790_10515 [Nitrosopumilus sp.]|uniref:hypothetical protein n=1 Tax=Nitrosopumilus sp. TaxID=2024843 RepID=UPI00247CC0C5|nr:hypothetical protein [Nitrosopumilus sp.]MCV0393703.1 hypothetical protein [Nitrosopumilus sp.]